MIDFLRDIHYPFNPEWKKPTAAMVQYIYPALVDIVVGVDSERLARPEPFAMEKHEINNDVYARGLPELGMLIMMYVDVKIITSFFCCFCMDFLCSCSELVIVL